MAANEREAEPGITFKPLFRNLMADDPEPEATEIESLCVNCGKNVR